MGYLYRNKYIMGKIIRLTENDLTRLVRRVISEQQMDVRIESNSRYSGTSVKDGKHYSLRVGMSENNMGDVEIYNESQQIGSCTMSTGYKSIPKGVWGCINPSLREKYGDFKNIKKLR